MKKYISVFTISLLFGLSNVNTCLARNYKKAKRNRIQRKANSDYLKVDMLTLKAVKYNIEQFTNQMNARLQKHPQDPLKTLRINKLDVSLIVAAKLLENDEFVNLNHLNNLIKPLVLSLMLVPEQILKNRPDLASTDDKDQRLLIIQNKFMMEKRIKLYLYELALTHGVDPFDKFKTSYDLVLNEFTKEDVHSILLSFIKGKKISEILKLYPHGRKRNVMRGFLVKFYEMNALIKQIAMS